MTHVTTEVKRGPEWCSPPSGVYSSHPNSHQLPGKVPHVSERFQVCKVQQSSQSYVGT